MSIFHLLIFGLQISFCISRQQETHKFHELDGCSKTISMKPGIDYLLSKDQYAGVYASDSYLDNKISSCRFEFVIRNDVDKLRYKICFKKHSFSKLSDEARIKYTWNLGSGHPSSYVEYPVKHVYHSFHFGPVQYQCLKIGDKLIFEYIADNINEVLTGTGNVTLVPAFPEKGDLFLLPPDNCKQAIGSADLGAILSNPSYISDNSVIINSLLYDSEEKCTIRILPHSKRMATFCYTFHYAKLFPGVSHNSIINNNRVNFRLLSVMGQEDYDTVYLRTNDGRSPTWMDKQICLTAENDFWSKVIVQLMTGTADSDLPEFAISYVFKEEIIKPTLAVKEGEGDWETDEHIIITTKKWIRFRPNIVALVVVLSVLFCINCLCIYYRCCRNRRDTQTASDNPTQPLHIFDTSQNHVPPVPPSVPPSVPPPQELQPLTQHSSGHARRDSHQADLPPAYSDMFPQDV